MNLRKKLALAGAGVLLVGGVVIPATMAQAAQSCEVVYTSNNWNTGFTANMTVRNTGDAWAGWTLAFTLPSGETSGAGWSANWSAPAQSVTATPLDWNRNIPTGGSTSIGFNGTWTGVGAFPGNPTAFTVNGVACNGGSGPGPSPTPSPSTSPSPTTPTISATPATQTVAAAGGTATVTLRRNAAPTSNVTVTLARSGSTAVTCPATATITPANWSTGAAVNCTVAAGTTAATSTFSATATGHTAGSFSISRTTGGTPTPRVDNPYAGAGVYSNPQWRARAMAEPGGSRIANQPTFVWFDRISALTGNGSPTTGTMGVVDHLNEAVAQDAANGSTPLVVQFVVYNLPGRDCAALASNGELGPNDLPRYKAEYIDVMAGMINRPEYANLRIVTIIEIDSLPNLVTNVGGRATATPECNTMLANNGYTDGVGYALARLGAIPNVYNYIDAAHHGWIGWADNFGATANMLFTASNRSGSTRDMVHGFITNTANTSALQEPFINLSGSIGGQQVRNSAWVDFNNYNDELSFAQAFRNQLVSAGFNSNIGMLIDTSRNGWGNCVQTPCQAIANRPTAASTSTDLNTNINQSRVDRRIHKGNWCNQAGAGLGERPRSAPATGIDAYVWAKPPGESDGSSTAIPNNEGKGFDRMCDPTYEGNARNGNSMTGSLPNAPLSGHWFPAQFRQLMANAFPALPAA